MTVKRIGSIRPWGASLAAVAIVALLVVGPCFAYQPGDPEFRGFWVDAWGAGAMNQPQVETLLGRPGTSIKGQIREANCNAVVLQVRRNCDANYPSSMGEPYMSGLTPSNFNALQAVINAAHDTTGGKQRVEVHAWMVTFRTSGGVVCGRHDDPPTGSLTNLDNYWLTRTDSGTETDDRAFDPGHPLAAEYTVNVAMDIVNNFDVDGIHFDYIRFTGGNQGYNPTSIARYNARYGLTGQPHPTDDQFDQWRRDQITNLVRKVYAKVQASKPHVKVSGSFVTWNPSPSASTRSAFMNTRPYGNRSDGVFSDWDAWMQEGIVDMAIPMTYYNYASLPSDWTRWMNFQKDRKANRHVYVGPGIYLNSLSNAILEIQQTRDTSPAGNKAEGFCGYSYRVPYSGGSWTNFSPQLVSQVTSTPATIPVMPWKTSPTKGHISGTVTYTDGSWADGAIVTLTGPETRSMYVDGTGFYAFIDITPGTYTVTARKTGYADAVGVVNVAIGSVTGNVYIKDLQLGGTTELIISDVQSSVTNTTATITWLTNLPATTQVEYGLTSSYGSSTTLNPTLVTSHSQQITGLAPSTTYHFRVKSTVEAGEKYSADYTFTTNGPPTISNVQATEITTTTAVIRWETSTPATSKVNYGLVDTYESSTPVDSTLVTQHSMLLSGLMEDRLYHFQCVSTNAYGTATTTDYTFTTAKAPEGEIVVDNLDAGWQSTGTGNWSAGSVAEVPKIGSNYLYYAGESTPSRKCRWTPFLVADGYYDVYAFYQIGHNRNTEARYTTYYDGGQITSIQNQYSPVANQGGWFLVAENKPFRAGSSGYLELTNQSSDTKLVSADAAKWVYRGPFDQTPPTVSISAPSAAVTKSGPVTYTVTYDGADTVSLTNADVTLHKTGTANGTVAVSGTGTTTRTVTIDSISGTGTLGISIAAGTASDDAGNNAGAAGPSETFSADNTVPWIYSFNISPPMAAVGDPIHVTVDTTDNSGVATVTANSTPLTNSSGNKWTGDILAVDPRGTHEVTVTVTDVVGNSITSVARTYKTVGVFSAVTSSAWQLPTLNAAESYLFKFYGTVAEIDDDNFSLGDGSARPITVHAPGYKVKVLSGDRAVVKGILTEPGLLESELALITKY